MFVSWSCVSGPCCNLVVGDSTSVNFRRVVDQRSNELSWRSCVRIQRIAINSRRNPKNSNSKPTPTPKPPSILAYVCTVVCNRLRWWHEQNSDQFRCETLCENVAVRYILNCPKQTRCFLFLLEFTTPNIYLEITKNNTLSHFPQGPLPKVFTFESFVV